MSKKEASCWYLQSDNRLSAQPLDERFDPSIRLSSVYLVNQLSRVDRINKAQVKLKLIRLSLG